MPTFTPPIDDDSRRHLYRGANCADFTVRVDSLFTCETLGIPVKEPHMKRSRLTALSLLLAGCVLSTEPLLPELTLRWAPEKAVRAWPVVAAKADDPDRRAALGSWHDRPAHSRGAGFEIPDA